MPVGISGQIYLSIQVDGVEIPLPISRAVKVFLNSNCKMLLPVSRIYIPDPTNSFAKSIPINDGSVISVRLHDDAQEAYPGYLTMRSLGTPLRAPSNQLIGYTINAMLDALPYVRANPSQAYTGNSAEVMQQIATTMNFNYKSTVAPNDKMTWMPGRSIWGKFANNLAMRGWIGPNSAIAPPAVDEQRNIYHIDINERFANAPVKARIFYGYRAQASQLGSQTPQYPATQYRSINRSGMLNNWHGYGLRLTQFSLTGAINRYSQIQAMTVKNMLDMSKDITAQIGQRARIDIPAFDTGNTHANYLQAAHQNLRSMAVYSQNIYVLIPNTTALTLYDLVEFDISSNDFSDDSSAGLYMITAITRAMLGSRYYEKLELTSAGPANNNTSLVA